MTAAQQKYGRQTALSLLVLCLFSSCVISITHKLTKDSIAQNRQQHTLKKVMEVMPLAYDNDLLNDSIAIIDPAFWGTNKAIIAYRARENNHPIGLVFMPIIAAGYNGHIELAIGIEYDGTLKAVRVNQHQETEGLGDGIDQSKTNWIRGFDQRSLANTAMTDWAVKKDGGDFDQLSGATISSRAVINAVKATLDYYERNRDGLYVNSSDNDNKSTRK